MSEDRTVLSFHDSLLKESDCSLLAGPHWINDKIIGFYFEYLEHKTYKEYSNCLSFITPDVAQFIKLYRGPELEMFLGPLNLHKKNIVFLPVNDNQTDRAGGCHWSLLVYTRTDNSFCHYDSSKPTNSASAKKCSQKLAPFLKAPLQPEYKEVAECPQQENCYDCGVFVMCFTDALCAIKLEGDKEERLTNIGKDSTDTLRTHLKSLIVSLAKE